MEHQRRIVIRRQSKNICLRPGLTLVEMVLAMAMMAILMSVLLPQLRAIQNSWDSNAHSTETLQNGRVLIDHLNRNLSKAARITAVSDSITTSGYIEFVDNNANSFRYDVNGTSNYVEFGLVGSLSDLAGPVSQLQFTCYNALDLSTPITDVNSIRSVKVETTLANAAALAQDMMLSAQAYIRANTLSPTNWDAAKAFDPWTEFDATRGATPALCQIDATHYLCAYSGDTDDGWAVVLTVDAETWAVTEETPFEFDTDTGIAPALAQIDGTHYVCAYGGPGGEGWSTVLTVDTGTWQITKETPLKFEDDICQSPALSQIDGTHYLCAYTGSNSDGWSTVLTVDTGTWAITKETPFEFDTDTGITPALSQIDGMHYLCAYDGRNNDGWTTVLTVNIGTWTITKETPFEFDIETALTPALAKIDGTHYLCVYTGKIGSGLATVLTVNTGTWAITKETPFEFDDVTGLTLALVRMDDTCYLCAYEGPDGDGVAIVLTVDTGTWAITEGSHFEFDADTGKSPALAQLDSTHSICAYQGSLDDGWAGVLTLVSQVQP